MHKPSTPALSMFRKGVSVRPIGRRLDGRLIYPIAGGAPEDPPANDDPLKQDDPPKFDPITSQADLDRVLGDRLQRERAKFADYNDLKTKAEAHDATLAAAMTDAEKAVAAARKEGEAEAAKRANGRLVGAEARALAAEAKFRSPSSAVRLLDLSDVKVNDDGEPDADAIRSKLKTLGDDEPYLLNTSDGRHPPKPDHSQGRPGGKPAASVAGGRDLWNDRHGKKTATQT